MRGDVIQTGSAFCEAVGEEDALFAILDSIPRDAAVNLALRSAFEDLPRTPYVALDGERQPRPADVLPTEPPTLRLIKGGR